VILIRFSEEQRQEAREYAANMKAIKLGLQRRNVAIKDHDIVGRLGEVAFHIYLHYKNIDHIWHNEIFKPTIKGDTIDFEIGKLKIDVKATRTYKTICANWDQTQKAIAEVNTLVGVFIDPRYRGAVMQGWAKPLDLERDSAKDPKEAATDNQKCMYSVPENKLIVFREKDLDLDLQLQLDFSI
jgi:hypothetical protein